MLSKAHNKLFDLITLWGGRVISAKDLDALRDMEMYECPFDNDCGIDYDKKILYYNASNIPDIGPLIHETAHIFASRKDPTDADEISFFAFEYTLACNIGAKKEWEKSSSDYNLGLVTDYGIYDESYAFTFVDYDELKPKHKTVFWFRLCRKACRDGLIVNGKATPIR